MSEPQDSLVTPMCIGFIMDGNRRWAKERGEETVFGYKQGSDIFADTVRWLRDHSIQHGVFYAFSSENWNRSEAEVRYLMDLFAEQIEQLEQRINNPDEPEEKVRFRFVGDLAKFSLELQKKIERVETESADYTGTTIWIALSYGGRDELVRAVNSAVKRGEVVDEASFRSLLWTGEMPDCDIIFRTGGQERLSNFLPWHTAYSEFIFVEKFWPDITSADLDAMLREYHERKRNFGK